jgi:hypothetical protein
MCLSKISEKKIATKNIVCYKVVRIYQKSNYMYTYYQEAIAELGETYFSNIIIEDDNGLTVEKGLHSFTDLSYAMKFIKIRPDNYNYTKLLIIKCVIPKGAEYYEGKFIDHLYGYISNSYASTELKYIKVVNKLRIFFYKIYYELY